LSISSPRARTAAMTSVTVFLNAAEACCVVGVEPLVRGAAAYWRGSECRSEIDVFEHPD